MERRTHQQVHRRVAIPESLHTGCQGVTPLLLQVVQGESCSQLKFDLIITGYAALVSIRMFRCYLYPGIERL